MNAWKLSLLLAACADLLPGGSLTLDLGEALQTALAQNPAIQHQLLEEARMEAEAAEARGRLLPSVQGQASEIRHSLNYEAFTGEPAVGVPVVLGPFSLRSVGVAAQVPLLDLSLWHRWRGAKAASEGTKAETARTREEISALVVGQYLLALRSEALVRAVTARIDLARALEDLAVHQEQSGVGTGLDTLRAKVRTRTEEQALLRAQTARQEALAGLVRLLDLAPDTELELKPVPAGEMSAEAPLGQDLAVAKENRAEFRALEAQGRAADERLAGASALHLPTVSAFGSYEHMGLVKTNLEKIFEVGAQVKVPLFMGGRIRAQEAQARAARAEVDSQRRDLDARVAFEIRVARERLASTRHEVEVAAQTLEMARAELEQARHRFEAGVSNNVELVSAQEELARAEEGHLDATYRVDQAYADLAHAKGELETHYGL